MAMFKKNLNIRKAKIDDPSLIEAVKYYPTLYDRSLQDFKNKELKSMLWRLIGNLVQAPAKDCEARFSILRAKYCMELRKKFSPSTAQFGPQWHLFDCMSFMEGHVKPRIADDFVDAIIEPIERETIRSDDEQKNRKPEAIESKDESDSRSDEPEFHFGVVVSKELMLFKPERRLSVKTKIMNVLINSLAENQL